MPAAVLCLSLLASLLCKFTIRDVGFVFIGEPLVEYVGGVVQRTDDGAVLQCTEAQFASVTPWRRALAQTLLESTAVIILLPGSDAMRMTAAVQNAASDLEAMSDAGRLARPLDGPVVILPLDIETDPVAAFALGWTPEGPMGAAVLYGRGRLAGPVLYGGQLDRESVLDQLELVAESCECDRPRDWLQARHLPLPWDEDLRRRATSRLGFDPHSPRIKAEMGRILARGPGGSTDGLPTSTAEPDMLMGYDEVHIVSTPDVRKPAASQLTPSIAVTTPPALPRKLFWFFIGIVVVVLVGIGMSQAHSKAA